MKLFLIMSLCVIFPLAVIAADETPKIDPTLELIHALGCKGCHMINGDGGSQAADLTQVGSRLTAKQIERQLTTSSSNQSESFMPNYGSVPKDDLQRISDYLYNLH